MTDAPDKYRFGVDEIAAFLREDLGLKNLTKRQVQWMLETGRIRSGKLGRRTVASERHMREDIARAAGGEAA